MDESTQRSEHAFTNVLHFEPSAYLQRLIGRDLVADKYLAIAELVKNAYDADATEVVVTLYRPKDLPQKLVIEDNGSGMSLDHFNRSWMMPGYSEKGGVTPLIESTEKASDRTLLGEKGIGRFAADKLSRLLTVTTKTSGEVDALHVLFDWNDFSDRRKKMRDVEVPFERRRDHSFELTSSGTRLELELLRETWELKDWRRLRRELQNLVTPFQGAKKFSIIANCAGEVTPSWKSGQIESRVEARDGYKYRFHLGPSGVLNGTIEFPEAVIRKAHKQNIELPNFNTQNHFVQFGPLRGAFYYVDSPRALKSTGIEGEEIQAGVAIYRDGFRVEPYGRESDDWLNVKTTKASRQGKAPITPSRLFGFIEISRNDNPGLRDRSNREGMQETFELEAFVNFVSNQFQEFSKMVGNVEDLVGVEDAPQIVGQQATKIRENRAQAFGEVTAQLAHQLRQPMTSLQLDVDFIRGRLEKQKIGDDKIIQALQRIEFSVLRMDSHVTNLSKLADGLEQEPTSIDLNAFVSTICQKHQAYAQHHGIKISVVASDPPEKVMFGVVSLDFILENFLTNALRAVVDCNSTDGEVIVEVSKTSGGRKRIDVKDTGKGIDPQIKEDLFVTSIKGAAGHGKGLFWSNKHAESFRGVLGCDNASPHGGIFFIEFDS